MKKKSVTQYPTIEPLTEEQFGKINFRCVCHINTEDEHATIYESVDFAPKIGMCVHVPYKDGIPHGRNFTHYMIDGEIFKTKAKVIKYINTKLINK